MVRICKDQELLLGTFFISNAVLGSQSKMHTVFDKTNDVANIANTYLRSICWISKFRRNVKSKSFHHINFLITNFDLHRNRGNIDLKSHDTRTFKRIGSITYERKSPDKSSRTQRKISMGMCFMIARIPKM